MKIKNTPLRSHPFTRGVAIVTAALFLLTGLFTYAPAAFAKTPDLKVQGGNPSGDLLRLDRDREIRIPPELGSMDEIYRVSRHDRMVIFIQDAHDSLEAQENIAKMIQYLVKHDGVKTVFEEGYEGPVPTDEFFGSIQEPGVKEKVSYFLMDHLRLGGAEYAHINRTNDFKLVGADSIKLHKENVAQYRLSAEKKAAITKDLAALEKELASLANVRFPKELREWFKVKERFDAKKLDLLEYLSRTMPLLGTQEKGMVSLLQFLVEAAKSHDLGVIEKAKHIDAREVYVELSKLEKSMGEAYLRDAADKELFGYSGVLQLLKRLNELQVTQEEYESVKTSLQTFNTESFGQFIQHHAQKPLVLSKRWEQNLRDAGKFYEIAKARDGAVAAQLGEFLWGPGQKTAVLVFGGFHKENIKRVLEAQGIGYMVVSPRITKSSLRHQEFYKRLMTEGLHKFEIPLQLATASRPVPVLTEPFGHAEIQEIYEALQAHPNADLSTLDRYLESPARSEARGKTVKKRAQGDRKLSISSVQRPMSRRLALGLLGLSVVAVAGVGLPWFLTHRGDFAYNELEKIYRDNLGAHQVMPGLSSLSMRPLYFEDRPWDRYRLTAIGDVHTHPETLQFILRAAKEIFQDPGQWVFLVEGYDEWKQGQERNKNNRSLDFLLIDELIQRTGAPVLDFIARPSEPEVQEELSKRLDLPQGEIQDILFLLTLGMEISAADVSGRSNDPTAYQEALGLWGRRTGLSIQTLMSRMTTLMQTLKAMDETGRKVFWNNLVRIQLGEIDARNAVSRRRLAAFLSRFPEKRRIFAVTGFLHLPVFDIQGNQPVSVSYEEWNEMLPRFERVILESPVRPELRGALASINAGSQLPDHSRPELRRDMPVADSRSLGLAAEQTSRSEARSKEEVGPVKNQKIPSLRSDEIAIIYGKSRLHGVFWGDTEKIVRTVKEALPDIKFYDGLETTVNGLTFYKRNSVTRRVWAFKEIDMPLFEKIFKLQVKPDAPACSSNEIPATYNSLKKVFARSATGFGQELFNDLPDAKTYEKEDVERRGVVFKKRKVLTKSEESYSIEWAFDAADIPRVAKAFHFTLRAVEEIPQLKNDETPVSQKGLKVFIGQPDTMARFFAKELPSLETDSQEVMVKGARFFKRKIGRGREIVWAFQNKDTQDLVKKFDLVARVKLPSPRIDEIAITGASLRKYFIGNSNKLLKVFDGLLPDPTATLSDTITVSGFEFKKRKTKTGRKPYVWVFNKKDKIKIGDQFAFELRFDNKAKAAQAAEIKIHLKEIYQRPYVFIEKIDITELFSIGGLEHGFIPEDFPLPGGEVWGKENRKVIKGNAEKVEVVISKTAKGISFEFVRTARSETRGLEEKNLARKELIEGIAFLYQRSGTFVKRLDITGLFSARDLRDGFIPEDFPLPGGKVWGKENRKVVKANAAKIEMVISKTSQGISFEFIRTARSEAQKIEKLNTENEIAVTRLNPHYIGGAYALARILQAELPDPKTSEEDQVTVRGITFIKRLGGSKFLWAFRRIDKSKIAEAFGLSIRKAIPDWDAETGISVSPRGLSSHYIGSPGPLALKLQAELPDLETSEEDLTTVRGITFAKRKNGPRIIWTFRKIDKSKVAEAFGLSIRKEILDLDAGNEISVSPHGLSSHYIGDPGPLAGSLQAELPDLKTSEEDHITVRGITFMKRQSGSNLVWTFQKADRLKLADAFNLKIRMEISDLNAGNEITVSQIGLSSHYVGDAESLARIFQEELPDPRTSEKDQLTVRGVTFAKRKNNPWIVWAFQKSDKTKAAKAFGLSIRREIPDLNAGNEITVSRRGLSSHYAGDSESLARILQAELPDPRVSAKDQMTVRGITFMKKKSGATRVWAFQIADRLRAAKAFGFSIRKEISNLDAANEIVVSLHGLRPHYIGASGSLAHIFQAELPDPGTSEKDQMAVRGITFSKRKNGTKIVWAFQKSDKTKIAEAWGLSIRKFVIERNLARKELIDRIIVLYNKPGTFVERIDVTELFSIGGLERGFIPEDFPLPEGKVWGKENRKVVKGNAAKIEALISKTPTGISLEFIRIARSETRSDKRDSETGDSKWTFSSETGLVQEWAVFGRKQPGTDYERVVATFEKYHLLDVAISLSANPEEMHRVLAILLTKANVQMEDIELARLNRVLLLNLGEQGDRTGRGPRGVQPGDPFDYLRALMALQKEVQVMQEHEQFILIRAFLRLGFNKFAKDFDQAMAEIQKIMTQTTKTPFLMNLIAHVEQALKQGLQYQPAHMRTNLYPHQRVGAWALRTSDRYVKDGIYGYLLEDDTRLGKTIQAYAAMDPSWKVVIVVPASVMTTWEEEYRKHTKGKMRLVPVRGNYEEKEKLVAETEHEKGVILLMSVQDLWRRSESAFKAMNNGLDALVIDEGQRVENYGGQELRTSSLQAKAIHRFKTQRKWVLSATPYTSHPKQLFSIFHLLHTNPETGKVTNPLYATRRQFSRLFAGDLKHMSWLYALKARVGLRRTKNEMGLTYSRKSKIPPKQEGAYTISHEQATLVIRIIKNLAQYLEIYNSRVEPDDQYDEESIGVLLKLQFLNYALTDPSLLGEDIPTTYWTAMDQRVLPRIAQGKKGVIFAQNKEIINRIISRYEEQGIHTARIDGTLSGNAQAQERHRFQNDPKCQLMVMNLEAGLGLDLSAADWELYAQCPKHYVEYYQSSDRAVGINPYAGEGKQKEIEVLFMMPQYPQEFAESLSVEDQAYVAHGTPAEVIYQGIMGEDRERFELVQEGIQVEKGMSEEQALTRLVHAIYGFLEDPSMSKAGRKQKREIIASSVFYPLYRQVKGDKIHEEEVLNLVEAYTRTDVSPATLGANIAKRGTFDAQDLSWLIAVFQLKNKQHRDRMLEMLPALYTNIWKKQEGINALVERGPPAFRVLAQEQPHLAVPFLAVATLWEANEDESGYLQPDHPGSQVLLSLLEQIEYSGLSDFERNQMLNQFISSLMPFMELNSNGFLDFLTYHDGIFTNGSLTIEGKIEFIETLGVLKQASSGAYKRIIKSRVSFEATQVALAKAMQNAVIDLFKLPHGEVSQQKVVALARQWGSLKEPLLLMTRLLESDTAIYGKHVELYRRAMKHILDGTYREWRNFQSMDSAGSQISYQKDNRLFWQVFNREENVRLGKISVTGKDYQELRSRKTRAILELLRDPVILKESFGPLGEKIHNDLLNPNALSALQSKIRISGQERQDLNEEEEKRSLGIGKVNRELAQLRLRAAVVELYQALQEDQSEAVLKNSNTVLNHMKDAAQPDNTKKHLLTTIGELRDILAQGGKARQFTEVEVQITSDPYLVMRRGMLNEEMKNCFNLNAGVRQIATLIDDLSSRNKMLAVVRSQGRIVSAAILKVRQTEDHAPAIMIERPLYRWGYHFEREIAQAIAISKLPEMPDAMVAGDWKEGDRKSDSVQLLTTGTRAPTEYHESLFGIREQRQDVRHIAGVIYQPIQTMSEKDFAQDGIARAKIQIDGVSQEILAMGHSTRNIGEFIRLAKQAGIGTFVDVRTRPVSQYYPQFNQKFLTEILAEHGIKYVWLGDKLGGKLPEFNDRFEAYMQADPDGRFSKGMRELLGITKSETRRVCILCSEGKMEACHRRFILNYLKENFESDQEINESRTSGDTHRSELRNSGDMPAQLLQFGAVRSELRNVAFSFKKRAGAFFEELNDFLHAKVIPKGVMGPEFAAFDSMLHDLSAGDRAIRTRTSLRPSHDQSFVKKNTELSPSSGSGKKRAEIRAARDIARSELRTDEGLEELLKDVTTKQTPVSADDALLMAAGKYLQDLPEAELNAIFKSHGMTFPQGVREALLKQFKTSSFKTVLLGELGRAIQAQEIALLQVSPEQLKELTKGEDQYRVVWLGEDGKITFLAEFYQYLNNIPDMNERNQVVAGLLGNLLAMRIFSRSLREAQVPADQPGLRAKISAAGRAVEDYLIAREPIKLEGSQADLRGRSFVYQQMYERHEPFTRRATPKVNWGTEVRRMENFLDRLAALRNRFEIQKTVKLEDRKTIEDIAESFRLDEKAEGALQRKVQGMNPAQLAELQQQYDHAYRTMQGRFATAVRKAREKKITEIEYEEETSKLNREVNGILRKLIRVDFELIRVKLQERASIRTALDDVIAHVETKVREMKWRRVHEEEKRSITEVFARNASDDYLKVKVVQDLVDKTRRTGAVERIESRWKMHETYYLATLKQLLGVLIDTESAVTKNPDYWKAKLLGYLRMRGMTFEGRPDTEIVVNDIAAALYLNPEIAKDFMARLRKWTREKKAGANDANADEVKKLVRGLLPDETVYREGIDRINYGNLFNFFRSRDHVVETYDREYRNAWMAIGFLEDFIFQVRSPKGVPLSAPHLRSAQRDLEEVARWVERAQVSEKTQVRSLVAAAKENVQVGQYAIATSKAREAQKILGAGFLERIERMSRYVSQHKLSVMAELDEGIKQLRAGIQEQKKRDLRSALSTFRRFKGRYLEGYIASEDEPGYVRAKRRMTTAVNSLEALLESPKLPSPLEFETVLKNLYRIRYDVEHKYEKIAEIGPEAERIEAEVTAQAKKDTSIQRSELRQNMESASQVAVSGVRSAMNFDILFEIKEPVVFVIEQARIDALSPQMFKELLGLAAINKEKLHLVIPDALQGQFSPRIAELRTLAQVHYGDLPEAAKLENVKVIGFSASEENLEVFKSRLGRKIAGRTFAYFGTDQAGNFAVALLFALQNIQRSELQEKDGYLFGTERLMEQALQSLWTAFTVISQAA